ncbi:MAG: hypothetical protein RJA36_360 [Pseudomonadota bacterium]|jgi:hypothetical protein
MRSSGTRRSFLGSILALGAAPAIVRADALMRVVPRETTLLADDVSFISSVDLGWINWAPAITIRSPGSRCTRRTAACACWTSRGESRSAWRLLPIPSTPTVRSDPLAGVCSTDCRSRPMAKDKGKGKGGGGRKC